LLDHFGGQDKTRIKRAILLPFYQLKIILDQFVESFALFGQEGSPALGVKVRGELEKVVGETACGSFENFDDDTLDL
jgi:hypothetical protein